MWTMWWIIPVFIVYVVVAILVARKCDIATTPEEFAAKYTVALFWPISLAIVAILKLYYEHIKKGEPEQGVQTS